MTDRPTTDRPDDVPEADRAFEVASALHDGEASATERADAGETAVQAHGRAVARVAERIADVPAPAPGLVDGHVGAALAAFDERPATSGGGASRSVASLAGRRPWWQRAPLGAVAAAAAVVALVGAIGLAAVTDSDARDETASDATSAELESAEGSADDSAGGGDGAETFDAGSGAGGAAGSSLSGDERAAFASYDELAIALEAQLGARATAGSGTDAGEEGSTQTQGDEAPAEPDATIAPVPTASAGTGGAAGCDAIGAAGIDPAALELVRNVVVDDQLITAIVHDTGAGRQLTSVDEASCTVVDERPL